MDEELRKIFRVNVCCRAVARDRYGVWTGVTENVSASGCLIVTSRMLRPGTMVTVTLASDLFPEELETVGEAAWVAPDRLGVNFMRFVARPGALSAQAWLRKVIEVGAIPGSASIVPCVGRSPLPRLATALTPASARSERLVRPRVAAQGGDAILVPLRRA